MSKDEIIEFVKNSKSKKVKVAITDLDGVLRGKYIHAEKFLSIVDGGFGFCDVVFGWDAADTSYENCDFTGWHTGYPDAEARIDLTTFRKVPWENDVPFLLADFDSDTSSARSICPRSLLKKINYRAHKMGYEAKFAQEFEWFNFKETTENLHAKNFANPETLTKGMFGYSLLRASQNGEYFSDLFEKMDEFDVTIEGIHTETGPGVYEVAILYDDIMRAADKAVLFKAGAKELGHKYGIMPTFMAKWHEDYPGCSGHVHQSLWQDNENVFFDKKDDDKMSETMKSYVAGLLHCLPQILPMYAPTINSYKRLVEGAWAPTTVTWGIDNRTTAIRVLPGSSSSTRIEMRVVGSDVNPYLAMSACLASGLYGIEKGLKLDIERTKGNGYLDKSNGVLPKTLMEATNIMRSSEVANEILGEKFVTHFADSREWEWQQFLSKVTDWEMKRYFEVI
jgi:glutamine synthetase